MLDANVYSPMCRCAFGGVGLVGECLASRRSSVSSLWPSVACPERRSRLDRRTSKALSSFVEGIASRGRPSPNASPRCSKDERSRRKSGSSSTSFRHSSRFAWSSGTSSSVSAASSAHAGRARPSPGCSRCRSRSFSSRTHVRRSTRATSLASLQRNPSSSLRECRHRDRGRAHPQLLRQHPPHLRLRLRSQRTGGACGCFKARSSTREGCPWRGAPASGGRSPGSDTSSSVTGRPCLRLHGWAPGRSKRRRTPPGSASAEALRSLPYSGSAHA